MQEFRRWLAVLATLTVGAASFALSFVALRDVAVALEAVPASLGWLVPVVIDGGVICGSAVIWSLSKEQGSRPWFPFAFVAVLVGISVVVNMNHAGPAPLAKVIAALPPLILLGTLELVASQGRRVPAPAAASSRSAVEATKAHLGHLVEATAPSPVLAMAPDAPAVAPRPAADPFVSDDVQDLAAEIPAVAVREPAGPRPHAATRPSRSRTAAAEPPRRRTRVRAEAAAETA